MKRALSALVLCAGVATAQAQETSGAYMGFTVGSFDYEENDDDLGISIEDTTSAYRILGGYRINDNFAVEGGWGTTSDIEDSLTEFVPGFGDITLNIAGDYEILTVRALGLLPLSKASLFAGVGYYDSELDASASVTGFGQIVEVEGSDNGATLVGGVQFDLERVSIRGEYEWFDTESTVEAWDVSVGLVFKF